MIGFKSWFKLKCCILWLNVILIVVLFYVDDVYLRVVLKRYVKKRLDNLGIFDSCFIIKYGII